MTLTSAFIVLFLIFCGSDGYRYPNLATLAKFLYYILTYTKSQVFISILLKIFDFFYFGLTKGEIPPFEILHRLS